MVGYVGEVSLYKLLSAQGVSCSLLSTCRHGRFEWDSYWISSENIQLLQSYIATYRKKLEEVFFIEEGFLYNKISKKDIYVDYGAMAEDAVKQLRFDSIEVGETNHYYSCVSPQPSFESFLFPSFWWGCKTWFCFSRHAFTASFCNFVGFRLTICYVPLFRSLTDGNCAISVGLVGNNSLIHLLRILTSLELFLNYEFYSKHPVLTDVYNNGKTVLG